MNKNKEKLKLLALTGLFTAMIYVLTAFIKVPTVKGYVHIGDAAIFLAGSILPTPYAVFAGAVGGALSDALSGYLIWVPATLLIKAATALMFTNKDKKILCPHNLIALFFALVFCVGGYGLYSGAVIFHSIAAGFADAAANTVQVLTSAIVYGLVAVSLEKTHAVKRIKI
ncbi:MAG: TIGR04002 family protein [Ruminococcus sp.]|nr:TIGR04002 family protein [Ruminococcus sp.]